MRIISGEWKGKNIEVPTEGTRPSMDKTRQALFNILQNVVEEATVLDLFSGSGALALEALSRGATKAVSVEADRYACRVIQKNVKSLGVNNLSVVQSSVVEYLKNQTSASFSLIFADPPYEKEFKQSLLYQALAHENLPNLLAKEAYVIAESPRKLSETDLSTLPSYWKVLSARKYGKSHITILSYDLL